MTRSTRLVAYALLALSSACASSSVELKEHEPVSASRAPWRGTALLLDYDIQSGNQSIRERGCTLVLHNATDDHDYSIDLPPEKQWIVFDAPAGTYSGKVLSCPNFTKWEIPEFPKGAVSTDEGRINFLGRYSFRFSDDGKAMKIVAADQPALIGSLAQNLKALPQPWTEAISNPFTHKPITRDMLAGSGAQLVRIHVRRLLAKGEHSGPAAELEKTLLNCSVAEKRRYPYLVGTISYSAKYQNHELVNLSKVEHHSFSDEFVSCLEQGFKYYVPPSAAEVQVHMDF